MRKKEFTQTQLQYLDDLFENVKSTNGNFKRDVPALFKIKYPNLDIGYSTLKNIHNTLKLKINKLSTRNESTADETNLSNNFLYSDQLLTFLKLNFSKNLIQIQNPIDEILKNYDLKIHVIPGDGLCFCSSIRLYFKQFSNKDLSIRDLKIQTSRHFLNNTSLISPYLSDQTNYEQYVNNSIVSYFDQKNFNSDFVDIFIMQSPRIFKINLCIIEEVNGSGVLIHLMKYEEHNVLVNLVILHKNHLHYNLIVPRTSIMMDIINNPDRASFHVMDCISGGINIIILNNNYFKINISYHLLDNLLMETDEPINQNVVSEDVNRNHFLDNLIMEVDETINPNVVLPDVNTNPNANKFKNSDNVMVS